MNVSISRTKERGLLADDNENRANLEHVARLWVQAQPTIAALVAAAIPNHHDAEDLLQDIAARLIQRADDYDPGRPFLPWALTIAKNRVADYYRERRIERHVFVGETLDALATTYTRMHLLLREEAAALERCINELTDRARRLLALRYDQDLKPAEIASQMGTSSGTVRVALTRIRSVLSDCMRRRGGEER